MGAAGQNIVTIFAKLSVVSVSSICRVGLAQLAAYKALQLPRHQCT